MRKIRMSLLALASVMLLGAVAVADMPGSHPAYMHALSNLHYAHELMNRDTPDFRVDEASDRAVREIEMAIRDCRDGARADMKDPRDTPPPSVDPGSRGRLFKAMQLLDDAYRDVSIRESNYRARDFQRSALQHIDEARRHVQHAIEIRQRERQHDDRRDNRRDNRYMPPPPPPDHYR